MNSMHLLLKNYITSLVLDKIIMFHDFCFVMIAKCTKISSHYGKYFTPVLRLNKKTDILTFITVIILVSFNIVPFIVIY